GGRVVVEERHVGVGAGTGDGTRGVVELAVDDLVAQLRRPVDVGRAVDRGIEGVPDGADDLRLFLAHPGMLLPGASSFALLEGLATAAVAAFAADLRHVAAVLADRLPAPA